MVINYNSDVKTFHKICKRCLEGYLTTSKYSKFCLKCHKPRGNNKKPKNDI